MRPLIFLIVLLVGALSIFGYQMYRVQLGEENVLRVENAQFVEQTRLLRENLDKVQQKSSGLAAVENIYGDVYDFSIGDDLNKSYGQGCISGQKAPTFIEQEAVLRKLAKSEQLISFCPYGPSDDKIMVWRKKGEENKFNIGLYDTKKDSIFKIQEVPIRILDRYCDNVSFSSSTSMLYVRCEYPGATRTYRLSVNTKNVWDVKACYQFSNKTVCATGCRTNSDCTTKQYCGGNTCVTVKPDAIYEYGP